MVQLAGSSFASLHGVNAHGHRDMGSFASYRRPLARIQPLPADLAKGIGTSLSRRPVVAFPARSRLGVQNGPKRRQERLSRFGIEVAVEPNHPQERHGGMQSASFPDLLVALEGLFPLDRLAPVGGHALQIVHRVDPSGLDERVLRPLECRGVGVPSSDEDANCRHREVAIVQRSPSFGHFLERSRDPHVLPCGSPRHLERARQPGRRREVSITLEDRSTLDLPKPPQALDLQQLRYPLQLGEVFLDPRIW